MLHQGLRTRNMLHKHFRRSVVPLNSVANAKRNFWPLVPLRALWKTAALVGHQSSCVDTPALTLVLASCCPPGRWNGLHRVR